MHSPRSSGQFKIEFLVHSCTFYNFQMLVTPEISQIDRWFKIENSFIFGHLNTIFQKKFFNSNFETKVWFKTFRLCHRIN